MYMNNLNQRRSALLIIREMKIKWGYHLTLIRMGVTKKSANNNAENCIILVKEIEVDLKKWKKILLLFFSSIILFWKN